MKPKLTKKSSPERKARETLQHRRFFRTLQNGISSYLKALNGSLNRRP